MALSSTYVTINIGLLLPEQFVGYGAISSIGNIYACADMSVCVNMNAHTQ